MKNNSIEDILIDKSFDKRNKKSNPIVVIFIILIILLLLAGAAYCYFTMINKKSNKELFFQGLLNTDLNFFVEDEIYEEIVKKVLSTNFEMNTDITIPSFVTNEESEEENSSEDLNQQFDFNQFKNQQEETDLTKYLLNLKTISNMESGESLNELNVSYEDNNIFDVKLINNKEDIAIYADGLVDEYVGINKNNIGPFLEKLGVEVTIVDEFENLEKQVDVEEIDIEDTIKQEKINQYKELLLSKLPEEIFIKQENQISLVKENSKEEIAVQAYKLSLTQTELNTIIKDILINFRNDEEFIKKIVTNKSREESTENTELEEDLQLEEILPNLLLGKKINATVEDVQKAVDEFINQISDDGNGLEIAVYVSELKTEKISIILPDKSTIDLELNPKSENEKEIIITYLYEDDVVDFGENNMAIYSAAENTIPEESTKITEKQTNGIKVEMSKTKNDASRTTKLVYNVIENKEITQKIDVDIKTRGTSASKTFNTDCLVTYSNNEGEIKVNLKNKINFEKISEIENLTEENCMYLDTLSDEELTALFLGIAFKSQGIFTNNTDNLNLIDENTQTPVITPNRDELRNLIVTNVGMQMGEAQARGENYTIQNIEGLQIDGHVVTTIMQNDAVEVTIDGIKFLIDSNFNLIDLE